jgi:hypothetical protein
LVMPKNMVDSMLMLNNVHVVVVTEQ